MGSLDLGPWRPWLEVDHAVIHARPVGEPSLDRGRAVWPMQSDRPDVSLQLELRLADGELMLRLVIENHGDRPAALGQIALLDAPVRCWGQPGDDLVALVWPMWGMQRVYRLGDKDCPAQGKVKMQFANLSRREAMQVGFVTFQRCDTQVSLKSALASSGAGHVLDTLGARCDMAGWELPPGQRTSSEWLRIAASNGDPQIQLDQWAQRSAEHLHVNIWPEAPIGYIGTAWTDTNNGPQDYQTVMLEGLDAVNHRLPGLGVQYLWTSMANFKDGMPGNWLHWNTQRIPMGREAFIHEVTRRGFIQGFWIGPFYICAALSELVEEFQDALLRNEDGSPLVVCDHWRYGAVAKLPLKQRPPLYALDPSHPQTLAFLKHVFETYRSWGVRYYMLDFLEAGAGSISRFPYKRHHDRSLVAGAEVYVKCMQSIREYVGDDTFLLSSTGPILHNAGLVDGVRVGNDFGEGRSINPESFFYPASFVINQFSFWTSAGYALNNHAASAHTHRRLYLNNSANVLTVDQPISLSEAHIAATLHAMSGGGSMLGDDLRHISDCRLALIKKTLPRGQGAARALDLFTSPQPVGPRVFHQHIQTPWQTYDVVALYNLDAANSQPKAMSFDLADLGLAGDQRCHLWDFWDERYMGIAVGSVAVSVPPGSVKVLRITPDTGMPTLVATDMHVLMGEVDILDATYDTDRARFHLTAARPAGEYGTAFIHAPQRMFVRDIGHLHIAKNGPDDTLVIGVPMRFDETGRFERIIEFGSMDAPLDMSEMNLA